MEKQVNIKLNETKVNEIDAEVEKNPIFNSRTHFVELAILHFLEIKPQKYFGNAGGNVGGSSSVGLEDWREVEK